MFGTITLSYSPGEQNDTDCNVTLKFSSEADMTTTIAHFENFLRSLGYPLQFEESLVIVKGERQ